MPILELAAESDPLRQGDLLLAPGLVLMDIAKGQARVQNSVKWVLVISRDCVMENKAFAVVAGVEPTPTLLADAVLKEALFPSRGPNDVDTEKNLNHAFEKAIGAFSRLRDGDGKPDRMYLGSLPGTPTRLWAMFELVETLRLPDDEEQRQAWVRENRVARLTPESLKALPERIFTAFCRGGYDDHRWFDTNDLEILENVGVQVEAKLVSLLASAKNERALAHADGQRQTEQKADRIKKLENATNSFRMLLQPYRDELGKRKASSAGSEFGLAAAPISGPVEAPSE